VVPALRAQWPTVAIEARVDGGGALPALYASCELAGDTVGPPPNARLTARRPGGARSRS
jgi:hypothetical protein